MFARRSRNAWVFGGATGSVPAAPPSSALSSRRFCACTSARSSVRSCQLCTAQNAPTAVKKVTCSAPKNMSVSLERSVMPSPDPLGGGGDGRRKAEEGDSLEQWQEEEGGDQQGGRERTLQEGGGEPAPDRGRTRAAQRRG